MKKRRLNSYDLLSLLSLIAILMTIGSHIAKPPRASQRAEVEIIVYARKVSGSLSPGERLFVDEKYEITFKESVDEGLVFICNGIITEAGFLLCGAKYLSANQPINIYAYVKGVEGFILKISPFSYEKLKN